MDYSKLYQFCTVRQLEMLQAVEKHGSQRKAAAALGVSKTAVAKAFDAVKVKAAVKGWSPEHDFTHPVPPGQMLRGVSTLYGPQGEMKAQWVMSKADTLAQEEISKSIIQAMAEEVRGLAPIVPEPSHLLNDVLCCYPFGDPHVGLYVWAKECGDDFDLEIGRKLTLGAVDRLMVAAPPSHTAILLLLGDVFHMNDQTNQTPAHRHQLDADSRFVKVLQVGIETYRHAVLRALEKHQHVIVKMMPGNHDPQAIWTLAFTLSAYFDKEPRVTVDLGPAKHWYYRFGKVLIGSTHGDTQKPEALPGIMAADRAPDWGLTQFRYWLTGHIHSTNKKEFPGVVWESFRTTAAADAYAMGHGYRAGRDMNCIVYHREYGEIERHRCDIAMLKSDGPAECLEPLNRA